VRRGGRPTVRDLRGHGQGLGAAEGAAHQSTGTASIGLELPGVTYCEPAYVGALDWLLCDALARIGRGAPDSAAYFRLSSRPLDQEPFAVARVRHGEAELRRLVLAAAHWPYVSSRPRWRSSC
jgi:pyruvate dehydrogenase E1 component